MELLEDEKDDKTASFPSFIKPISSKAKSKEGSLKSNRIGDDLRIKDKIDRWSKTSALVGDDDFYEREKISKISICREKTMPQCMAYLWNEICEIVQDCTYRHDGSWTVSAIDEENNGEVRRGYFVMIALPDCPDLCDYRTFSTFHASLEFTNDRTNYFGHTFRSIHFHPLCLLKDERRTHGARRSPVPIIAFTVGGLFDNENETALFRHQLKPTRIGFGKGKDSSDLDKVKSSRIDFEIIFNRAAASGVNDNFKVGRARRNYRKYSDTETIQASEKWISANKNVSNALKYTPDPGKQQKQEWFVCKEKKAEDVYMEVWRIIGELYARGIHEDKSLEKRNNVSLGDSNTVPAYISWLEHLGHLSRARHINNHPVVITSMFVCTKYCAFNSEGFRKFAITINAALKRITNKKMSLEIFHPEYIGKKGYNNSFRRSPYPMIQFCYYVGGYYDENGIS